MLDTSRHFISLPVIKQLLDAMALAKFSVFHWHIMDDQSFPIELKSFPNLTANAAFSKKQVYSSYNVKDIVAYAASLGLRVIPEMDNPGHTWAVGLDPEFRDIMLCWDDNGSVNIGGTDVRGDKYGVLDPTN
jgi:hexosaminidase